MDIMEFWIKIDKGFDCYLTPLFLTSFLYHVVEFGEKKGFNCHVYVWSC